MNAQKTYKTIKSLEFDLMLYPNSRQQILDNAGKNFKLGVKDVWFIVAEDGSCALFDKDCKIDDLSKVKTITEDMIRKDIKSINIPDSVEIIKEFAFYYCKSLKSVSIPNSVESIGNDAFSWCESLESINISDSVISIGIGVFSWCESLERISISNSVEIIGNEAFFNCTSLKEVIFKGKTIDEVKSIKNYPWGINNKSIIKVEF